FRRQPDATCCDKGGEPGPDRFFEALPRLGCDHAIVGPSAGMAVVEAALPRAPVHDGCEPVHHPMPAPWRAEPPLGDTRRGGLQGSVVDTTAAEPLRQPALVHWEVCFSPCTGPVSDTALDIARPDPGGGGVLAQGVAALGARIRAPACGA